MILCCFCLAILSPGPSGSPAATPFSAYVCLILSGLVCLGLGVCAVMLRDFQLMGWRGWEGERGRARRGYRIGGEKRRGRVDGRAKCFGPECIGADYLPQKETAKVKWKLKDFSGGLGIHFSGEIAQFCSSILNRSTLGLSSTQSDELCLTESSPPLRPATRTFLWMKS